MTAKSFYNGYLSKPEFHATAFDSQPNELDKYSFRPVTSEMKLSLNTEKLYSNRLAWQKTEKLGVYRGSLSCVWRRGDGTLRAVFANCCNTEYGHLDFFHLRNMSELVHRDILSYHWNWKFASHDGIWIENLTIWTGNSQAMMAFKLEYSDHLNWKFASHAGICIVTEQPNWKFTSHDGIWCGTYWQFELEIHKPRWHLNWEMVTIWTGNSQATLAFELGHDD